MVDNKPQNYDNYSKNSKIKNNFLIHNTILGDEQ